jgi:hypothetical protein
MSAENDTASTVVELMSAPPQGAPEPLAAFRRWFLDNPTIVSHKREIYLLFVFACSGEYKSPLEAPR